MKNTSEPIVFFGSGPVAAASLRLLAEEFVIEAVVTKPRPAHHKGDVPVLDAVADLGLPVHTVSKRSELDTLIASKPFHSELGILIDFGIIVSQQAIDYFPLGIINSHFSILPELRGADPISFAILSGQQTTGVSLMLLVAAMDEGPLLSFGEQLLAPDITTPQLTDQLIELSHALLIHAVPEYLSGGVIAPQTVTGREVSYTRKLSKEDGALDWTKPAVQLEREIRAYADWPKSRATIAGKDVIITQASVTEQTAGEPGKPVVSDKRLVVTCGTGSLVIERLKPAGKAEMTDSAFLAGYGQLLS